MTASQPQGAPNTTGSVPGDGPDPYRATQGENVTVPKRIQRKRSKGWRKPEGAVIVDRTSRWGNPFQVADHGLDAALQLFEEHLAANPDLVARARVALAGKDLACWCGLDQRCHGDIWLRVVNAP